MQRNREDRYEREPLDASRPYESPSRDYQYSYPADSPYHDDVSPRRPEAYARGQQFQPYEPAPARDDAAPPPPPQHNDFSSYNRSPSRDATRYEHGQQDALGADSDHGGQLPPPPSRAQHPRAAGAYSPEGAYRGRGLHASERDSRSSLNPFGTPSATHSPARSLHSFGGESYPDDPYQGMSSSARRYHDASLGIVNPNEIADDGDDGIVYERRTPNRPNRNPPPEIGAAAIVEAEAVTAPRGDYQPYGEKSTDWLEKKEKKSKRRKWLVIILVVLVVVAATVGGVVGSMFANKKSDKASGQSAADDTKTNGDLDINSSEIQKLLNNKDLHKVFPGIDYTPLNTQYPDCVHNPPSQNNITRDVAVLSQLTNKIRLYGTDCNQTQMVIHATRQLKMDKDIKIWLGVWQDNNKTTNARQLEQMWTILDDYGATPFEGIIVANEILFREQMTLTALGSLLDSVRSNLTDKNIKLPVATSDLGNDWSSALAAKSDYIMSNVHPFFAGVAADEAAAWTWNFWKTNNGDIWKSDKSKNIIAETGWPSGGGKDCGQSPTCDSSTPGAVASIDNMNKFMSDWVCQALANGTNYFWFEAFDEPWKVQFNTGDKNWEDKWGLMDVDRNLKSGVKIPDCGGKTV